MTYRPLSCSTTEDATGKPSGKNRGKKNILALLLVPALLFPSLPAGGADKDGGSFLEKCLGDTEKIERVDMEAGIEAGVSARQGVWVGRCLHMSSTVEGERR